MDNKALYRSFGILSFVISLVVYLMTVQPVVPFWDCGEFSAASIWQQVPHPPGAPLFLMLGKLFHTIIPFGDPGWRLNLVAVVSSAFTVWFLYLIAVKVIENLRSEKTETLGDALAVYGSAFVGAMALTFSDTFWFNSVESEVYATSSLFVGLIIYLMMRWNEKADDPGHEKYLLLIAYLIGLSMGVHLLAILTIFSISMLVYFRKYKFSYKTFTFMTIISLGIFFITYKVILTYIPQKIAESTGWAIFLILIIALIGYGIYYGKQKRNSILALASLGFILMLFGFTTYTQILLRANANPPMNENKPHNFEKLVSYLGREQYGTQRNWPRRTDTQDEEKQRIYRQKDANGEYVYGPWDYEFVRGEDGGREINYKTDNWSELKYMWDYQINHMYIRYFLWNYVGRSSDQQNAEAAWFNSYNAERRNYKSGYASEFPVRFFALPLLLGLMGMFFHFWKDPKMAFVYMIMFLMMGVLTAISQNQQNPQPRERDYFYAGSFYVWALWIGMGAYMLIDWLKDVLKKKSISPAIASLVLIVSMLAAPINMALGGWKIHSRAGNYLAFDYSYNILQSVEKDAILFTAGDNDTFPVWYLQDVMGVRRDVRIVNLSLGNTLWYVYQLKNREPWGAKKVPLNFPDKMLLAEEGSGRELSYFAEKPFNVTVPVSKETMAKFTDDPKLIKSGKMTFLFKGSQEIGKGQQLFTVEDQVIREILVNTKFERPVYFSTTAAGGDTFCGLDEYLRLEGMALRVCPVKQHRGRKYYAASKEICDQCFLNVDNSNDFSLEPKYGFKFRNLANMDVYYDRVQSHYMYNYRQLYIGYAYNAIEVQNDKEKASKVIDAMNENISPDQFPLHYFEEYELAEIYKLAGNEPKANEFYDRARESCYYILENPDKVSERVRAYLNYDFVYFDFSGIVLQGAPKTGPYTILMKIYDNNSEYEKVVETIDRLYNDWLVKYRKNPQRYYKALMSKDQSQQDDARFFAQNIASIYQNYAIAVLNAMKDASFEQKAAKIKELKEKFTKTAAGDQLLNTFWQHAEENINAYLQRFKPVANDSLTVEEGTVQIGN